VARVLLDPFRTYIRFLGAGCAASLYAASGGGPRRVPPAARCYRGRLNGGPVSCYTATQPSGAPLFEVRRGCQLSSLARAGLAGRLVGGCLPGGWHVASAGLLTGRCPGAGDLEGVSAGRATRKGVPRGRCTKLVRRSGRCTNLVRAALI
jgi:hypothetical protein